MNTGKFLTIPADEYHAASRSGQYMSSHLLADFRESPELYRRKTSGEIAEAEGPALALGRAAHCLILKTPLFRVRKTKESGTMRVRYCYSEKEREAAVSKLGNGAEQTRFKGLGEITPEDFTEFIGKDIRLLPVTCTQDIDPDKSLSFYMGDNMPARRDYIMRNLVCTEKDIE